MTEPGQPDNGSTHPGAAASSETEPGQPDRGSRPPGASESSEGDPGAGAAPASARSESPPLSVDPSSLKALAHPLRVRMYDLLGDEGSATASQLGARLGESSGTTSYHLRLLAKHGFIEEDPDRGNQRDRYWKVRGYNLEASGMMDNPETAADLRAAANEIWRTYARQIEGWYRSAPDWGSEWMSATVSSLTRFEASRDEMIEVREAVMEVLREQAERIEAQRRDDDDVPRVRVAMQFHLFPLGQPPTDAANGPDTE